MTIVWASVAFALSIFFFGLAFQQFRRPGLPAWLGSDLAAQLVCAVIVTLFSFGCGFLVNIILARETGDAAAVELGAGLAALALASVLAFRLIVIARRYGAAAPYGEVIRLVPAQSGDGDKPIKPVRPRRSPRKAA